MVELLVNGLCKQRRQKNTIKTALLGSILFKTGPEVVS